MSTGSPMSSTRLSPAPPIAPHWMTSSTASGMVMKYRVTRASVRVMGPPRATWSAKVCSTEPRLPSTLPNRTDMYSDPSRAKSAVSRSAIRLVQPSTEVASAALSVEMLMNRSTPTPRAACSTFSVPHTLLCSASPGLASTSGRCFSAAAWNTTSGFCSANTSCSRRWSRMSARTRSPESSRAWPSMLSWTACRALSSRSSMMSALGRKAWICRHSSEPIEPPAPVTRMRRSVR